MQKSLFRISLRSSSFPWVIFFISTEISVIILLHHIDGMYSNKDRSMGNLNSKYEFDCFSKAVLFRPVRFYRGDLLEPFNLVFEKGLVSEIFRNS